MKTVEYLKLYKEKFGLKSNYAVAKKLEVTEAAVANWYHGKGFLSDDMAIQFADELELHAGVVLADIHAERAGKEKKPEVKKKWEQIARELKSAAACFCLVMASTMPMDETQAAGIMQGKNAQNADMTIYTLYEVMLLWFRTVSLVFAGTNNPYKRYGYC